MHDHPLGLGAARRTVWFVTIVGIVLTIMVAIQVVLDERSSIALDLVRAGEDLVHRVEDAVGGGTDRAQSVAAFVESSDQVTPQEFISFASSTGGGPSVLMMGYRPLAVGEETTEFFYVSPDEFAPELRDPIAEMRIPDQAQPVGPISDEHPLAILVAAPVSAKNGVEVIGVSYLVVDLAPVVAAPHTAHLEIGVRPNSLSDLIDLPIGTWRANSVVGPSTWSFEVVAPGAVTRLWNRGLLVFGLGLLLTGAGAGAAFLQTSRRTTERALEELKRIAKEKDRFMASVSHELRTPLTSVVGLAGVLRTAWRDMEEPEVQGFLEDIHHESEELADLVEDLLTIGRDESGVLTYDLSEIDLDREVDRVVRRLARKSSVELAVAPGLGSAVADPLRFRQIIRNLLVNACRHAEEIVEVDIEDHPGQRVIRVSNDGKGIPSAEADRLFQPYQAGLRTGQPGSIGLGLYVSRRLARGMGGDLRYVPDDELVVFEVVLPRDRRRGDDPVTRNAERAS